MTNLRGIHLQRVHQHQLGQDDCRPLKVYRLPAIVLQVVDLDHGGVHQPGHLR